MNILQLTYTDSLPVLTSHRSPLLTIWRRPRETVRWIVAENPSLHVMWLACLAGIGDSLSRDFARDTGDRSTVAITVAIVGACIRGPLWGLLNFWIFSHLIRWTGGWIGGKATREHLKAAMAWALVPMVCGVPLWIPLVVNSHIFSEDAPSLAAQPVLLVVALLAILLVEMSLAVWAIVLLCQTVAEVQGFRSGWRALGNLFMSASLFLASVLSLAIFFS
jgi:Yip1 domain